MLVEELQADGERLIIGTLILVKDDAAWIAPYPKLRSGEGQTRSESYWKKAYCTSHTALLERTKSSDLPRLVLTPEVPPELWQIDEAYFSSSTAVPLSSSYDSAQLKTWATQRDQNYSLIEPIVKDKTLEELLYDSSLNKRATEHAHGIGSRPATVLSLLNRYIHAGAHKRGVFPRTFLCGGRGKPKFFSEPCGRPNRAFKAKATDIRGFVCTKFDRINCELGWGLFKTPERSVDDAYSRFINHFYAAQSRVIGPGRVEVVLLPQGEYPTKDQFQYFGRMNNPLRAPALINVSARERRNNIDGHGGNARSHYTFALQAGIIDSTSDDQGALCSVASPLLMLQSTWTTRIVCVTTGYIFGEYTSFERPSARTHMAAIVHAATPKVQWAKSIGYELKEGEWHYGTFKSTVGDNGEGKCIENIGAHSRSGMEAVFTQVYLSRARSIVENCHLMSHYLVDWRNEGSTMGKMRNRGEKLNTDSPYDYTALLHRKIAGVLHINNVDPVEHLLTLEMRRQGVKATRRGIFEYMLATGQVADGPDNILEFLPSTLPRLHARISKEGLRIWDPRESVGRAYVPGMIYWASWLAEEGFLTAARWQNKDILVAIDPMYIGRIYVDHGTRWREVNLQTNDIEKLRLTFVDWLAIADNDSTNRFFVYHDVLQSKASLAASTESIERAGAARKAKVMKHGEQVPKGKTKRQLTREEVGRGNLQRLGIDSTTTQPAKVDPPALPMAREQSCGGEELPSAGQRGLLLPSWMTDGVMTGGRE